MKDRIEDAMRTNVNLVLIIRTELDDVRRIKEELHNLGCDIVYQNLSVDKLYVCKKRDAEVCPLGEKVGLE